MVFDEKTARTYDDWFKSPIGRYVDTRGKRLILDLLAPKEGERLLDVGCKTGNHLLFFRRAGCDVTGIDSSLSMLETARKKLGNRADFHSGSPEDLPFSDNEFDVVTLINCLELVENPQKAIEEAIRVSRERVFLGFLNKYSFNATQREKSGIFPLSLYNDARFFSIREVNNIVKSVLSDTSIRWGSVIFLPLGWYTFAAGIEERIPVIKNPFGSFVGLTFPVVYTRRTLQDPIQNSLKVGAAGGHLPGAAREMKK
jgi:ubiquinone/menaquinone biosynthesis C-methylase UbiE